MWAPFFSTDGNKVAFNRTVGHRQVPESRLASREVFVVNVNGTGLKRLTKNTAYDGQPTFVPGTDIVAFVSNRDGNEDIYAVRLDGSGLTNLTDTASTNENHATFSANGAKMAYASVRRDSSGKLVYEIYTMELSGTN